MELLLPFHINPSHTKISYTDKLLLIGSCFTEDIGNRMKEAKFNVLQNPNGILYDPLSIGFTLTSYIENKKYTEDDLFFLNELWHSWHHHSVYSGPVKENVLQKINLAQSKAHQYLDEASWLVITTGTAFKYYLQSGQPVANCHKAPSSFFEKKLLSIEIIRQQLADVIQKLQAFNPKLKIICTVSPVRHIRDGVIENNKSKARLIEATHSLVSEFKNVCYFPAYELIIDVLRDYRFYNDDLVHPTSSATGFVFEKFCSAFVDYKSLQLMAEIKGIVSAMKHKPFHPESDSHEKFRKAQLEKINRITEKFPSLDLAHEISFFS